MTRSWWTHLLRLPTSTRCALSLFFLVTPLRHPQFVLLLSGSCVSCPSETTDQVLSVLRLGRLWRVKSLWNKIWAYVVRRCD